MRTIKIILFSIVGLLVLFFAVGFLLPREVSVERSIEIDASPQEVFEMVNDFQQFNRWQPWAQIDPDTRYVYEGPATGAGSRMMWYSDHPEVGDGKQEIILSEPYSKVRMALDFGAGGLGYADYLIDATDDGSELTWTLESDMGGNPIARYIGLALDGMIGPSYEQGLANLKNILEPEPEPEPEPLEAPAEPQEAEEAQAAEDAENADRAT